MQFEGDYFNKSTKMQTLGAICHCGEHEIILRTVVLPIVNICVQQAAVLLNILQILQIQAHYYQRKDHRCQ